ncbi:hypothetical protein GFS31_40880 (plasmid) [Leptolyngbya sp. BL0902]|nr:hypothetical protein GFS31_40880 [Leptolyngbya sp. BL0902]
MPYGLGSETDKEMTSGCLFAMSRQVSIQISSLASRERE